MRASSGRTGTLQAQLASIDQQERRARERPAQETYVGFHELESLLPTRVAGKQRALPPALAAALRVADVADKADEPEIPPIPDALAASLGRAGVQALWEFMLDSKSSVIEPRDWQGLLPHLVKVSLTRSVMAYEEGRADAMQDKLDDLQGQIDAAKAVDDLSTLWVHHRHLNRVNEIQEGYIETLKNLNDLDQKLLDKYRKAIPDAEIPDSESSASEQES